MRLRLGPDECSERPDLKEPLRTMLGGAKEHVRNHLSSDAARSAARHGPSAVGAEVCVDGLKLSDPILFDRVLPIHAAPERERR
jgi:hypothetical protein